MMLVMQRREGLLVGPVNHLAPAVVSAAADDDDDDGDRVLYSARRHVHRWLDNGASLNLSYII